VIAICGALPAIAEESPSLDTVVATVNGEVITLGEMISVRAGLPEQYHSIPSDVLFGSILEQLVQQTALAQGLGETIPQRVEISLNNERRTLLAAEALEAFVLQNNLSDDELRASYDDKYQGFVGEEEFSASHILVPTEEEAQTIRKELTDGADFAETAKAKSTGPSGASGGSLGWFGMGQMVKPFEEAVVELAVGEISQPVQTQFGWHLILLNDARKSLAPSFEDAKAELESEAQRRAVESFIATTTDDAHVDQTGAEGIDPSVLAQIQLLNPNTAQDQ
jgi:peptidyl-prolyl cis-trans isomerase C